MPGQDTDDAQLPFHKGYKQKLFARNKTTNSEQHTPASVFILPSFFRAEGSIPYTAAERQSACQFVIAAKSSPPCHALCLPNMQPNTWSEIIKQKHTQQHAAAAATMRQKGEEENANATAHHTHTCASLLSHHYRRMAKLVHPDKCADKTDADEAFKILHHAYTQLNEAIAK